MNAIMLLVGIGALIMWGIFISLKLIEESLVNILEHRQSEREIKLLSVQKPAFIMDYLKFKKDLNCWNDTKREHKW